MLFKLFRQIMDKANVNVANKEARRQVDLVILEIVVWAGAKCPEVWRVVKEHFKQYAVKEAIQLPAKKILGGQGVV